MNKEKKVVNAAIMTPYLFSTFEDRHDPDEVIRQIQQWGYSPDNLTGIHHFDVGDYTVVLHNAVDDKRLPLRAADVGIAGSTPGWEDKVAGLKGSGLIVARYSGFYGGQSDYTRKSAAQGGYSLDIPKRVENVKAFLQHEGLLEGVVARDHDMIVEAVEDLNSELTAPVLVTPYLAEALEMEPRSYLRR